MIEVTPYSPKMVFERETDPDKFDVKMDVAQRDFQHSMKDYMSSGTALKLHEDMSGYFYPSPTPIVIIVNGTARSGKDTFVDICEKTFMEQGFYPGVVRMSSVDRCYTAVNDVFLKDDNRPEVRKAIENKEDAWRQFMHEVKMSWSKFCNGPTQYIINQLKQYTECDNTPAFVFMFLREPEEIKSLVDELRICGYLSLTVFISGHVKNTDWKNDCDSHVTPDAYPYDVYIRNESTLEDYQERCKKFMLHMIQYRNNARTLPEFRKYLKSESYQEPAEMVRVVDHSGENGTYESYQLQSTFQDQDGTN